MKDIAKDLGISAVTVSKVLRNHPDIGEETRARVLKHVKERDYQPNILARSLVTGRSFLVGLIVPDLIHPFFAEIARSLSLAIRPQGYSLIISSSEEDAELEALELRQLLARHLDAIVIASTAISGSQFDRLEANGPPYVMIDRAFADRPANFVGVDDVVAGRIATEHLIDVGCRRIAHIGGRHNSTGVGRQEGYMQALLGRGLPYSEDYVVSRTQVDNESTPQGAEGMRLLLEQHPRPDGVFCYNDPMAIGAINAILEAGLRVPEDIAVIGCGNLHYDGYLRVPLSSVDQQSRLIGQRAGEIVMGMLESKEKRPIQTVILEPAVVVRASTMRA